MLKSSARVAAREARWEPESPACNKEKLLIQTSRHEGNMSTVIKEECWPSSICRWKKLFQIWLCVDKYFQICLVFCEESWTKTNGWHLFFTSRITQWIWVLSFMLLILLLAEFYPFKYLTHAWTKWNNLIIPHCFKGRIEPNSVAAAAKGNETYFFCDFYCCVNSEAVMQAMCTGWLDGYKC